MSIQSTYKPRLGRKRNRILVKLFQSKAEFSYRVVLQDWGQSLATPHTVGKLAEEYHDEHTESPPRRYKLESKRSSV